MALFNSKNAVRVKSATKAFKPVKFSILAYPFKLVENTGFTNNGYILAKAFLGKEQKETLVKISVSQDQFAYMSANSSNLTGFIGSLFNAAMNKALRVRLDNRKTLKYAIGLVNATYNGTKDIIDVDGNSDEYVGLDVYKVVQLPDNNPGKAKEGFFTVDKKIDFDTKAPVVSTVFSFGKNPLCFKLDEVDKYSDFLKQADQATDAAEAYQAVPKTDVLAKALIPFLHTVALKFIITRKTDNGEEIIQTSPIFNKIKQGDIYLPLNSQSVRDLIEEYNEFVDEERVHLASLFNAKPEDFTPYVIFASAYKVGAVVEDYKINPDFPFRNINKMANYRYYSETTKDVNGVEDATGCGFGFLRVSKDAIEKNDNDEDVRVVKEFGQNLYISNFYGNILNFIHKEEDGKLVKLNLNEVLKTSLDKTPTFKQEGENSQVQEQEFVSKDIEVAEIEIDDIPF